MIAKIFHELSRLFSSLNAVGRALLVNDTSRYTAGQQSVSLQTATFVGWSSPTMPRIGAKAKCVCVLRSVERHGQAWSTLLGGAAMANYDQRKRKTRSTIESLLGRPRSVSAFGSGIKNRGRSSLKHTGLRVRVAMKRILNSLRLTTLTATDMFTEKRSAVASTAILSSTDSQKTSFACSVSIATMLGRFMASAHIGRMIPKITALAAREQSRNVFRRLAENKGSPAIDWEDVICMVKAG